MLNDYILRLQKLALSSNWSRINVYEPNNTPCVHIRVRDGHMRAAKMQIYNDKKETCSKPCNSYVLVKKLYNALI